MKMLNFILIAVLSLMVLFTCEKTADQSLLNTADNDNLIVEGRNPGPIPFKADFYTIRRYLSDNPEDCMLETYDPVTCGGDFSDFNLQCGEGTGTHLGKFTTMMSFCGNNLELTYANGEGVFVAANGDELYFYVPSPNSVGQISPYDHPVYDLQFQDEFTFNGGTGRFEGAAGGGYTDSYVDVFDENGFIPNHRTDHKWTGTLILP